MSGYLEAGSKPVKTKKKSIVSSKNAEIKFEKDGSGPSSNRPDESIDVKGEGNVMRMGAMMEKMKRRPSVTAVEGNIQKNVILSYNGPKKTGDAVNKNPKTAGEPAELEKPKKKKKSSDSKPPKPEKAKKPKKPKKEMKTRGMCTEPAPITVCSGTWTDPVSQVTQRVGTMDPQRAEIAVQIVPEETQTVAKRHVAMGTEHHHVTRSVGEHLWTEDQETETEILTRETGADPVTELLEDLLKADR